MRCSSLCQTSGGMPTFSRCGCSGSATTRTFLSLHPGCWPDPCVWWGWRVDPCNLMALPCPSQTLDCSDTWKGEPARPSAGCRQHPTDHARLVEAASALAQHPLCGGQPVPHRCHRKPRAGWHPALRPDHGWLRWGHPVPDRHRGICNHPDLWVCMCSCTAHLDRMHVP